MICSEMVVANEPTRVAGEQYEDVFEAARMVGLPAIVVLWLTWAGVIPGHPLRESGLTCWKFKRRDLERVRADIESTEQALLGRDGVQVIQ
jgi:hypothetical protein